MKTVFLTGATGFIGAQCIQPLLQRGYKIIAVSSKPQIKIVPGLEWVHLDLKDEKRTEEIVHQTKPSHLLHLAWYAEPPYYWQSNENVEWLRASLHLVSAFLKSGGNRVVIAGTCAEYEWGCLKTCNETETPCVPISLYGTAKYALFLMVQKLAQISKVSFSWGRLFHLYGPGEHSKKLVRSVISGLLKKKEVPCSSGEQIRDYLYISDAADAMAALLDSECQGAVNLGSGKPIKISEIINQIGEKIGNQELIHLRSMPISASDPSFLVPCTNRLVHEVKWKPETDLNCGLNQTIEWLRHEIHN